MKLAFVVQRYGLEINGGAELHCRWVAEHMKKYGAIDVLTTRAFDYITWKNHYPAGEETVNGVPVKRFPVVKTRNPERFGRIQKFVFEQEHREEDELRWLEEEGPCAPALVEYIRENRRRYDLFIFFSYRYYHSYWGIKAVPDKSILVPTAERDPVVGLRIFRELFRMPRAFVYNSVEERRMIQTIAGNEEILGDVVGVGTEVPAEADGERFRKKFGITGPYILYMGRIDENKGCHKLFEYFLRYKRDEQRAKEIGGKIGGKDEAGAAVKLVLIGSTVLKIPAHPDVDYLGFVSEQDKFDGLAGATALVMPSFYESLSMVTLEAWAMRKPVLSNAKCEVLKGQCLRSNAGLFYEDYPEFREALGLLMGDEKLRAAMGENGQKYYEANYTWEIIENKYLKIINALKEADK